MLFGTSKVSLITTASRWPVPVALRRQKWGANADAIALYSIIVGEPDIAIDKIYYQIINAVEMPAKMVVQRELRASGGGVQVGYSRSDDGRSVSVQHHNRLEHCGKSHLRRSRGRLDRLIAQDRRGCNQVLLRFERSTARSFPGRRWARQESFRSPNVHSFLAFAPSSGSPRSLLYTTKAALDRSSKEGSVKLTLSVCLSRSVHSDDPINHPDRVRIWPLLQHQHLNNWIIGVDSKGSILVNSGAPQCALAKIFPKSSRSALAAEG